MILQVGLFTNSINKTDDDDEDDDDMISDALLIMVEKPHNTPQIRIKTVEMNDVRIDPRACSIPSEICNSKLIRLWLYHWCSRGFHRKQ